MPTIEFVYSTNEAIILQHWYNDVLSYINYHVVFVNQLSAVEECLNNELWKITTLEHKSDHSSSVLISIWTW